MTPSLARRLRPALAAIVAAASACADGRAPITAPDVEARFAKPVGPGATNAAVTSTLADGLSYASDGGGAYVNGTASVESSLQDIGDYVLSTQNSRTRTMRLSFAAVDSGAVPFTGSALVKGRFISKISRVGGRFHDMRLGDTELAPLAFAFTYGTQNYRLAMNPENTMGVGTQYAAASCVAAASAADSTCATWQLTPTGIDGTNVSRLIKVGSKSETAVAKVRVSFQITFSR